MKSGTISIMQTACVKAQKVIMRDFHELENLQTSQKELFSFVERSYQKSANTITRELEKSGYKVFLESPGERLRQKQKYWLALPLDSKSNFMPNMIPLISVVE